MRARWFHLLAIILLTVGLLASPLQAQPADAGLGLFYEAYAILRQESLAQPTSETLLRGADAGLRALLREEGQPPTVLGTLHLVGDERADVATMLRRIESAQSVSRSRPIAVAYAAISGMVAALRDPNSAFYPPGAFAQVLRRTTTGDEIVGIGIVLQDQAGQAVITEVLDNSPASEAGLQAGDQITAVNGTPTAGLSLDQISQMIRGAEGTEVSLSLRRPGQVDPITVTMTRRRIQQRIVTTRMLPSGVGYLRLTQFTRSSPELFARGLRELLHQGARGIVLDLRGNPGGLLDASVSIASHFMESGKVVTLESGRGSVTYAVQPREPKFLGPLVILVDRGSASASEVVAGALQDAGIKLVGTRTYGKATVQGIYNFPDGSGMRLTISRYLTPAGRDLEGRGLEPDVEVATGGAPIGSPEDAPLNRAVGMLLQMTAGPVAPVLPLIAP
ncbi:MAG: S41 family peptidase [Armatimonadota bacterium]|nr:S41 family peptidase [Armatimonadota bacterium]MDR7519722.1 S41 family peptidase [Armatimonadota bacterium]MDR7549133.1 S41 family peptidase [Armatimonadota bacterium]